MDPGDQCIDCSRLAPSSIRSGGAVCSGVTITPATYHPALVLPAQLFLDQLMLPIADALPVLLSPTTCALLMYDRLLRDCRDPGILGGSA